MVKIEYTDNYYACEDGTIYSEHSQKKLAPRVMKNGYAKVCITDKKGQRMERLVHRLICEAFHGAPPVGKYCVNHIDCDKTNNRPENLEWCSYEGNMLHASQNRLLNAQKENMRRVNLLRRKPVIAFDDNGDIVATFPTIDAARQAGYTAVSHALKKNIKSAGLNWRLK